MPLSQEYQGKVRLNRVFENYTVYVFKVTVHPIFDIEQFEYLRTYAFAQRKKVIQGTDNDLNMTNGKYLFKKKLRIIEGFSV
jgi:hypothetical protein